MRKITIADVEYLEELRKIENPPKQLWIEGKEEILQRKKIAIVGSRCCSEYGRKMASKFARELSQKGICIVSGLAKGIDAVAHQSAMQEKGGTIAILGSGMHCIYPKENKGLFQEIVEQGLVISEYEPDTEANSKFFPERNRIVSGMCLGTLVIEAAYRSGTSITVALTRKQKKPVFCIPNQLEERNGVGTNQFLKQGAKLITSVEDIMQEIGEKEEKKEEEEENEIKEEYREIYEMIKNETMTRDSFYARMPEQIINIEYLLTMMEIEGIIHKDAGGIYQIEK